MTLFYQRFFIKSICLFAFLFFVNNNLFSQWEDYTISNSNSSNYKDIFTLENHIWILGDREVHKSSDGGESWQYYAIPDTYDLNKVYFLDATRGFVVGNDVVAKTVDGGITWTIVFDRESLGYENISNIYFNGNKGWFVDSYYTVYKTEDAGENWSSQALPFNGSSLHHSKSIFFADDLNGYIIGGSLEGFYKTTDGGTTWKYHSTYIIDGYYYNIGLIDIFFKNSLEGWGCGLSTTAYHTTDGGISWNRVSTTKLLFPRRIHFLNDQLGWAFHSDGDISKTVDRGNTWFKVREGFDYDLNAIEFDHLGNGWIVGESKQLLQKIHQPEIVIKYGQEIITKYDTIPNLLDHTDFGDTITSTFTILNTFTDTLVLTDDPPVKMIGSADFKIIDQPKDTILFADSTQFTVEYISEEVTSATVVIKNNTLRDSLFEFQMQGNCPSCIIEGDPPIFNITLLEYPEKDIRDTILKDSLCYKFSKEQIFQIENIGTETVRYDNSPTKVNLIGDSYQKLFFKISKQPQLDSLLAGQKDTFNLVYQPPYIEGVYQIKVNLPYNAVDSLPYEFTIKNKAYSCPDTAQIMVFLEGDTIELATHTKVDTICLGEGIFYRLQLQNISDEYAIFDEQNGRLVSENTDYTVRRFSYSSISSLQSKEFRIDFIPEEVGSHETLISIPYNSKDGLPYSFRLKTVVLPYETVDQVTFCNSISTGGEEMVSLSIPDTIVQVGKQFCVPVFGENLDFPDSVAFSISWNDDSLTYRGLYDVALHLENVTYWVGINMTSLSWSNLHSNNSYFPDPKPLFELCFIANTQGAAELNISASAFNKSLDGSTQSLDFTTKSSTIHIVEFSPICVEEIVIIPDNISHGGFYQAENWIITDAGISPEANVTLQAGNHITLIAGFHTSGNFLAQIKDIDCLDTNIKDDQPSISKLISPPATISEQVELTISPNPFATSTTIRYYLPKLTKARLRVYSIEGKLLEEIVATSIKNAGFYEATFSMDSYLDPILFVELTTEDAVIVKKIIHIR